MAVLPRPAQQLAARILDALPQTQCQRCGYADCAGYAAAVASGEANINQCPPGGAEGVRRLAALTQRPVLPLNPDNGSEGPRGVAWIDEAWCIGCTLCIKACPVDCIIGTNKAMHTVVEDDCTGCELCVEACPVDCIHMDNTSGTRTGWDAWSPQQADRARQQYAAHQARQAHSKADKTVSRPPQAARSDAATHDNAAAGRRPEPAQTTTAHPHDAAHKRAAVAAALARARQRRQST